MRKLLASVSATLAVAVTATAATVSLKLYPPEIRVHAGNSQMVLLVATGADGVTREVTPEAKWSYSAPSSAVIANSRTLNALKQGSGELVADFDGVSAKVSVEILPERHHELSFINDIVPIFTRADCANSNCHGSVRGQKGFKLSLFGSDPQLDYDAITKNSEGRRINRDDPSKSLVLLKPTMQIAHGGDSDSKWALRNIS